MAALLVGSVLLILMATTMPWSWYFVGHPHWASVEWIPLSLRFRPDDFLLNVLLFVPFGYTALRTLSSDGEISRRTLPTVVCAAALLSVSVEIFQVYCHGRFATTVDIASNSLGAWVGARIAAHR